MSGSDHELVSFAVFLDYRTRRGGAPLADPHAPPAVVTVPVTPEPDRPGLVVTTKAASLPLLRD